MPETAPAGAYAIATPHVAATAAGRAAFEAGGNAVDAALAAACAIAVVYPHMCAVGGDVMALVHDGEAHAVNGSGRAPAALRPGPVPLRGVGSITVPGAVRAWETLAGRWGSRPLSQALLGAAALAHDGVGVAPSLGRTIVDCRELIAADAGLSAVFAPGGRLLAEGETLVQQRLGATLERLAERGADDLYAGETGAMLVAGLRDAERAARGRRSGGPPHRRLPRAAVSGRRRRVPDDGAELAGLRPAPDHGGGRARAAVRPVRARRADAVRDLRARGCRPRRPPGRPGGDAGRRRGSARRRPRGRAGGPGGGHGGRAAGVAAGDRRHDRPGRRRRLGARRLADPEHLLRLRVRRARADARASSATTAAPASRPTPRARTPRPPANGRCIR